MNYYIILAALVISSLLTFIFSRSFRNRGPLGGLLVFFLIVFMTTWSGQLWITPVSPLIWGVDWVLLIFTALLFSFLMVALSSPAPTVKPLKAVPKEGDVNAAIGIFLWILLISLVVAIIAGYYRINKQSKLPDDVANLTTDY